MEQLRKCEQGQTAHDNAVQKHPAESELEAAGLGYPLSKVQAVLFWHQGFHPDQQRPVAHRLINAEGEVMTDWHDGPPPDHFIDLCGVAMAGTRVELAYATLPPARDELIIAAEAIERVVHYVVSKADQDVLRLIAQEKRREALADKIGHGQASG